MTATYRALSCLLRAFAPDLVQHLCMYYFFVHAIKKLQDLHVSYCVFSSYNFILPDDAFIYYLTTTIDTIFPSHIVSMLLLCV